MSNAHRVYERLAGELGGQGWWPGESPFEVLVGAVLVQNTAWKNVEQAIGNLREEDLLEPVRLLAVPVEELEELIRPAGYYRLKTKRLRNLLEFVVEEYGGSLEAMAEVDTETLRGQLLAINGIGPETADSILLYALEKPVFVVDTYTQRIFSRHGWVSNETDYHQLQEHLVGELPRDVQLYNEMHALLVNVGHHFCRKTPKCEGCPLVDMLPEGGIAAAEF